MSTSMDAQALDRAWDAQVLRKPFPEPFDDALDRLLLDLLADSERPAPNPVFTQALERELAHTSTRSSTLTAPPASRQSERRTPGSAPRNWPLPLPSYPRTLFAAAAIMLVLLSGIVVLSQQDRGIVERPPIPAASQWTDEGPPTSLGVDVALLFSHTYAINELEAHAIDDWGWIAFLSGSAAPGQESWAPYDPGLVGTYNGPGLSVIGIETGAMSFQFAGPVVVSRHAEPNLIPFATGDEVTLEAGDSLLYGQNALAAAWNPTDDITQYVAGGLYTRPGTPLMFPSTTIDVETFGTSIASSFLDAAETVGLTISTISLGPGETYAYSIRNGSLLLAFIAGGGVRQQQWSDGIQEGPARTLIASSYTLHNDPVGYYTLTNTGAEPVEIYFFEFTVASEGEDTSSTD